MAVFTESFTSAVDDVGIAGSLTTDLTWTAVSPTSSNWEHYQNQASPNGSGRGQSNYARAEHDTTGSDQYAEFVVTTLAAVANNQMGPCVRFQPAANSSYMAMVDGEGIVVIRKTIAGSRTSIGAEIPVDITGLPKVLRTEVEGSTIRAYWAGVLVDTVTDTDLASGTRAGLFGHEANTNNALGVIIDSFEFGDLSSAITLVVAGATHAHSADAVTLTQDHQLAAEAATHGHTADSPALTQVHQLTVEDATHTHTADQVTLTGPDTLDVADAQHNHAADSPTLTQVHVLAVADATHAHSAEVATLIDPSVLIVNLHFIALAPELGHGTALAPEVTDRTALAPELAHAAAGAPETTARSVGPPELGHGAADPPETAHGQPEVGLGHGNPGEPEL